VFQETASAANDKKGVFCFFFSLKREYNCLKWSQGFTMNSYPEQGRILGGAIPPTKTYESNLIHHIFVQFWKNIRDLRPLRRLSFCEAYFVSHTDSEAVMRLDYQNITEIPPHPYWLDPPWSRANMPVLPIRTNNKSAATSLTHNCLLRCNVCSNAQFKENQFRMYSLLFSIRSVTSGLAAILAFSGQAATFAMSDGESVAALRVNRSLALTHQGWARGWTDRKYRFQVFGMTRESNPANQLLSLVLSQLYHLAGYNINWL